MQNRPANRRKPVTCALAAFALAAAFPFGHGARAQDQAPRTANDPALLEGGGLGIPEHEAGERVLEQVLPDSVGTPSQDERVGPAAGELGQGFDADPTGPLGRSTEAPLGRAGAAGGGGAIIGESFGGGGVRVDGESSGGGGVDIDRRSGQDLTPGLSGSGGSPGLGG